MGVTALLYEFSHHSSHTKRICIVCCVSIKILSQGIILFVSTVVIFSSFSEAFVIVSLFVYFNKVCFNTFGLMRFKKCTGMCVIFD